MNGGMAGRPRRVGTYLGTVDLASQGGGQGIADPGCGMNTTQGVDIEGAGRIITHKGSILGVGGG